MWISKNSSSCQIGPPALFNFIFITLFSHSPSRQQHALLFSRWVWISLALGPRPWGCSPPQIHSYEREELIESVCPQYLCQTISSHLLQFNALHDDNSLLLQIPNMVEMDINMLGMFGSLTGGEHHGALVIHIERNQSWFCVFSSADAHIDSPEPMGFLCCLWGGHVFSFIWAGGDTGLFLNLPWYRAVCWHEYESTNRFLASTQTSPIQIHIADEAIISLSSTISLSI